MNVYYLIILGQNNTRSQEAEYALYQKICILGEKKHLQKEAINSIIDKIKREHSHYSLTETYDHAFDFISKMSCERNK